MWRFLYPLVKRDQGWSVEDSDWRGRGGGASLLTQEVQYLHTCSLGALLAQPQILLAPQDLSALPILHQGAVTHPPRVQHCNVWELS